jgi:hypothetical protein
VRIKVIFIFLDMKEMMQFLPDTNFRIDSSREVSEHAQTGIILQSMMNIGICDWYLMVLQLCFSMQYTFNISIMPRLFAPLRNFLQNGIPAKSKNTYRLSRTLTNSIKFEFIIGER